jgi:hypothetical protein
MSSKSSKRSTKKRSSLQDSNRVKTLHQLLWLSGALQASGLLSHEKLGAVAWTKRPNHSKLYGDRAKSSRIGQIASMKKFGDPDGVGSFLYGRVEKKRKKPWKPEESEEIDLRRLPTAPPTQLPTVNELKALDEQLQNELNKQTRRNRRMSVSRRANQSLRSVKRSLRNSTRNAKSRSMHRQSHH